MVGGGRGDDGGESAGQGSPPDDTLCRSSASASSGAPVGGRGPQPEPKEVRLLRKILTKFVAGSATCRMENSSETSVETKTKAKRQYTTKKSE